MPFDHRPIRRMNEPVDLRIGLGAFEIAENGERGGDIAEGGGYTTQFILFSPPGARPSSGWLRFYSQAGVPLNLSLK